MRVPPLQGGQLDGEDFVLAEWVDNGETSAEFPIAPLHSHDGDDEAWYVLEGTLGIRCGDEVLEVPAGAGVLVPRGVPHTFWNAGTDRLRYLILMTPRVAALVAALHEPGADAPALFARFDSRLIP